MTLRRQLVSLGVGALGVIAGCTDFGPPVIYRFEPGMAVAWPDTLAVSDTVELPVTIRTQDGQLVTDVDLTWEVTDSAVLRIIDDGQGPPRATALRKGPVEVIVRVDKPGTESAELRDTLEVVPLRFEALTTGWPDTLTLTQERTVFLSVFRASGDSVELPALRWRSSDPEVLGVTEQAEGPADSTLSSSILESLANRTAVITARRSGLADIVVGIDLGGAENPEFRVPVQVVEQSLIIPTVGWPSDLSVSDVVPLTLDIRDAADSAMSGLGVRWESTNEDVVTVVLTGTDSTTLSARSAGLAEVVALIDPTGLQPTEVRIPIDVAPLTVQLDAFPNLTGAVDTTFMVARDTIDVSVRILDRFQNEVQRLLPVRWESSDPSLEVIPVPPAGNTLADSLAARSRVRLFATGAGDGQIRVMVGQSGVIEEVSDSASVEILERWIDIATGGSHACGLNWNREAYCWGGGMYDATNRVIGVGAGYTIREASPVRIGPSLQFGSIVSGWAHSCAITGAPGEEGQLFCWGANDRGQIGDRTTDNAFFPTPVSGGHVFFQVSAGARATCGVSPSGGDIPAATVRCWGVGDLSGLPLADSLVLWPNVPAVGLGITSRGVPVNVGTDHVCFGSFNFTGTPGCWGQPPGSGLSQASDTATAIASSLVFQELDAGTSLTCGIATGLAYCWGLGIALGDGVGVESSSPQLVSQSVVPGTWAQISAGHRHACGVTTSGGGYCWGSGPRGALGDGTSADALAPVRVSTTDMVGDTLFTKISAGGGDHFTRFERSCGVTTSGVAYCWGSLSGTGLPSSTVPTRVPSR